MRFFSISFFFIIVSCSGSVSKPLPEINFSVHPTSLVLGGSSTFSWSSSNTDSCSASWTSQTSTSGQELVIINNIGNNVYFISCDGIGGIASASVTVEAYREIKGVVVDGYISGAQICIDENENWNCDKDENFTTSDNEGKFTIRYENGSLISLEGIDLDSQIILESLLINHKLTGHSDFKAVTPVTSIAAFMEESSHINAALGVDSSIDVFAFDPVANKGDHGINDYLYEKGNQLTVLAYALQNITNELNTKRETTQDYFKAIAEEIEKEYNETSSKVDIENEDFISKALDNIIKAKSVIIDEDAKTSTIKSLAGVMPVIEVKSSHDLTTAVIRFALSTLQIDIKAIASGIATNKTVKNYTENILNYIANDQNIDSDEITPDINAISDTVFTLEDTSFEVDVLANDSYITSAPVNVTTTNGFNGTTKVISNVITYEPNADFNGIDTFSYTITQGDKVSSANVTVTIQAVNDLPSIDISSTLTVPENQIAVATVSVSDVDEDDLILSLSGADAYNFNLSSDNVLSFKEAPDYETKNIYYISLHLTDGIETVTKNISITITNVNDIAPVINTPSNISTPENQLYVINFDATDKDGDNLLFLISDFDYEKFNISSVNGSLSFKSEPDFETKNMYKINLKVTDGVNLSLKEITIKILNVKENNFGDCTFGDCKFGS